MKTTQRPRIPLLAAAVLLLSGISVYAEIAPHDYNGLIGPLSEDQFKQQQAFDALRKSNPSAASQLPPSHPPAVNPDDPDAGSGDLIYANTDAAGVNNIDGVLREIGPSIDVPGELPAGATVKDYAGKRYYCDVNACMQCPTADCASVIPPLEKLAGSGQIALDGSDGVTNPGGQLNGGGKFAAGSSGSTGGNPNLAGGALGTALVPGQNSSGRSDFSGGSGGLAGQPGSGGRRVDEPKPRTISALVQDVVLPAVDPLTTAGAGVVGAGENGATASGGAGSITSVADKKAGGTSQVRYTGGSFDSLGAINDSKALKQTDDFGATKGDNK